MTGQYQAAVAAQQPGHWTARGQEFQATQSLELPLGDPWASQSLEDRQARLQQTALRGTPRQKGDFLENEVFISTFDFGHVTDTLDGQMRHAKLFGSKGGLRVAGEGGSGKDAIIRYCMKRRPSYQVGSNKICPLISVTLGGYLAPTEILGSLHTQLGSAHKAYQGIKSLEELLLEALSACQTEGIIFNEAQHMLRVSRPKSRSELRISGREGDWLKGFIDRLPIPQFFFGVPGWDDIFNHDRQLGTRIPNRYDLTVPNEATFLGILQALDEAIPMPEPAGLVAPRFAEPILKITKANWRLIIKLLRPALESAAYADAERIQTQDLSYSYFLNFGAEGNPFGKPRTL